MGESQFQKVLDGIGGAALIGVHILLPFLHAWRVRWGATDQELAQTWRGDELVSWLFYVYEMEGDCTRFVTRWRLDYPPGFKNELMNGRWGLEPIASAMDFKMLKGVRLRAEAAR